MESAAEEMTTEVDVELESAPENGRVVYRLTCKGIASPPLRSADAAKWYFKSGAFTHFIQAFSAVTQAAANDARKIDALSDKELQVLLEPPTLLTTSQ